MSDEILKAKTEEEKSCEWEECAPPNESEGEPVVQLKPLSRNAFIAFFQKLYRRWLGVWYDYADRHEKFAPLLYKIVFFFVFSLGVTIWQYIVMTFLPYAFSSLDNGPWGWPNIPVPSAGGVPYIIFGDANGFGYFISFEIAVFTAQCINFPLQRNITYKSHGNPYFQALWYFIGWAAVSVATSALWGIINSFFTYWDVPDALSSLLKTLITGLITMIIFFFIFLVIFPDRQRQANSARKRYEKLLSKNVTGRRLEKARVKAETTERKALFEKARRDAAQAASSAEAKAVAWNSAVRKKEKLKANGAALAELEAQDELISKRFAIAKEAALKRIDAMAEFDRVKNGEERTEETPDVDENTVVIKRGEEIVFKSAARGISPLVELIESGTDVSGCSAYDKIVGKAAALLYVKLGVSAVKAEVMSEAGARVLEKNGIAYDYDVFAKNIINRAGDGICPMECAVDGIDDPDAALDAVKTKLKELRGSRGENNDLQTV